MALKGRRRSQRTKRLSNVSDEYETNFDEMHFSSSDTDPDDSYKPSKIDGDHIYTCGKSSTGLDSHTVEKRRKRNASEDSDQKITKQRCFSKNAVMARLNRERKKAYVSNLEAQNEKLQIENEEIKKKIQIQNKMISSMKQEISYLKGMLANSKEIGQILQNLKNVTGLPVTSSLMVKSPAQEDCKVKETNQENVSISLNNLKARSVNCGFSFPIVNKDINLGSSSDMSLSCSSVTDLDSSFFNFNNLEFENVVPNLDADLLNNFDFNLNNYDPDEFLKGEDAIDGIPSAGICLHVNKERISVEFCSICNSKAGVLVPQSTGDPEYMKSF